jgi:hypothetical protein
MTIKVTRVTVKQSEVRKLLKGDALEALLGAKALAVADRVEAAGIRVEGEPGRIPLPVTVTVTRGRIRSRARVILDHPSGLSVESKHALLAGAIDAARNVP